MPMTLIEQYESAHNQDVKRKVQSALVHAVAGLATETVDPTNAAAVQLHNWKLAMVLPVLKDRDLWGLLFAMAIAASDIDLSAADDTTIIGATSTAWASYAPVFGPVFSSTGVM